MLPGGLVCELIWLWFLPVAHCALCCVPDAGEPACELIWFLVVSQEAQYASLYVIYSAHQHTASGPACELMRPLTASPSVPPGRPVCELIYGCLQYICAALTASFPTSTANIKKSKEIYGCSPPRPRAAVASLKKYGVICSYIYASIYYHMWI